MGDQSANLPTWTLIIQTGPQVGQIFSIQDGVNTIGSDPARDIYLLDPSISPNHARIVRQPEGVWIQDLGSTYGTFMNDQPLTASVWLQPGDRIQVGTSVLEVQLSQPGFASPTILPHSQRQLWSRIGALVTLLLVAIGVGVIIWRFVSPPIIVAGSPPSGPTISIIKPTSNTKTGLNAPLIIHASARDEQRVRRVELWVNDVLPIAANSDSPEGEFFLPSFAPGFL